MEFRPILSSEQAASPEIDTVPDRRAGQRFVSVLKVGRVICNGEDQLCVIRNISRDGMKIELAHALEPDARLTIELRSDRVVHGTVRWSNGEASGIEFDEAVRVEDILDSRAPSSLLRKRPRAPRFARREAVELESEKQRIAATLIDISLQGVCLEANVSVRAGDRAIAYVAGLPPRSGTVRWAAKGRLGLHFERPWPYGELAQWLDSRCHN